MVPIGNCDGGVAVDGDSPTVLLNRDIGSQSTQGSGFSLVLPGHAVI